jgi:hypothetical protein
MLYDKVTLIERDLNFVVQGITEITGLEMQPELDEITIYGLFPC